MYNNQLELVSTGICRGEVEITNELLAESEWVKYNVNGFPESEKRKTSAEDIYNRLGIKSRPHASNRQNHANMFNEALDQAIIKAKEYDVNDIKGNIIALFTSSTTELKKIPAYLDDICEYAGLHVNHMREFISQACAGFNNGVNRLSRYVEENPDLNGYAIVGASEIIGPLWREDNFDKVLFGDLSGVAIFKVTPSKGLSKLEKGILGEVNVHVPDTKEYIVRRNGFLYMDGKSVMRLAPDAMIDDCMKSIGSAGLNIRDINKFIFHSGSKHILHKIGLKMRRIYGDDLDTEVQLPDYLGDSGNNGATTTINILHRGILENKIKKTDRVYLGALGMGIYRSGFIVNGFPYLE